MAERFTEAVEAGSKLVRLVNGFWKGLPPKRATSDEQPETIPARMTEASSRSFTGSQEPQFITNTLRETLEGDRESKVGFSLSPG